MSYHLGSVEPDERAEGYAAEAEDYPRRPHRSLLAGVLAVAVMGAFAGGLWFAYKEGTRQGRDGGDAPLIRAEPGPTRVKPDNPGGMEIPDRDVLIYRDVRPTVERLLPPPEKPLPRPAPPPAAAPAAPAQPASAAAPASPPAQAAAQPPQPAPAPPAAAGGTRLQLGALRSQEAAEQEWQRIKRANADLLGQLEATVGRADLGEKGVFWRIESKPVADPIAALQLCEALKQRKLGCVLAQ